MTELFANNASSTLNGAITNVATTLVVTSATSFPGTGNFRIILGSTPSSAEIVLVTGVSGTTFTIVRAQEGTSASAWGDTTIVTHILTAGSLGVATTGGGDISGSVQNASVIKIRGGALASSLSSLGSSQDGYTLTWVNGNTDWEAKPTVVNRVQNGANYSSTFDIVGFSVITTTSSATFVNAATFELDTTLLTAASGTRTISLRVIGETTAPQMTIQLFNLTAASVVTGSTLTTSSTTPTLLSTGDLTANLTNGVAVYQVQIKMAAGTPTDRVVLDLAKLRITWS